MRRVGCPAMHAFIVCLQSVAYRKMLTDGPLSAPRHFVVPSTVLGIRLRPFLVPEVGAFGTSDSASRAVLAFGEYHFALYMQHTA